MNTPLRIGLAAILAAVGVASCGPAPSTAEASAAPISSGPCDQGKAEAAYSVAMARGVVVGQDVSRSEGIVILVNPRRFRAIGIEGQKRLAAQLDCGIAGVGHHVVGLHFRQDRTGSDLNRFEAADLLTLRDQGYAG